MKAGLLFSLQKKNSYWSHCFLFDSSCEAMGIYFLSTGYCACYIILKAGDIFHTFSGVILDVLPCTCAQESFNNNIKYETQKAMSSITVSLTQKKAPVFRIAVVVLLLRLSLFASKT